MGIPFNEAMTLVEQKSFSDYYEALRKITKYPKAGANWILGPVRGFLNENNLEIEQFSLNPKQIAELIQLVKEGKLSFIAAKEQVFPNMVTSPEKTALKVATELNVILESAKNDLEDAMNTLMENHPDEVARYRSGKKNLKGFFVGQLMRQFKGKANPKEVNEVVEKQLQV